MKILLFSDLQLTNRKEHMDYRLSILHQITALAIINSAVRVVCVGDFFDITNVSPDLHTHVVNAIKAYPGQWVFVAGNHDQYGALSTVLDPYSLSGRIIVVTKPVVTDKWLYMPYSTDIAALRPVIKRSEAKYAAVHVPLAWMERSRFGVEKGDFVGLNRAFCGHYHVPKADKTIQIMGSPYEVSFDDASSDKHGIWLLDDHTNKLEFLPLKYRKHITVTDLDKIKDDGNVYRLEVTADKAPAKMPPGVRLKIIPPAIEYSARIDVNRAHDTDYLLTEYLKKTNIDPKTVKGKQYLKAGKELLS